MSNLVDESIRQLNTTLAWLEAPRVDWRRWQPEEDAVLRDWWGRIPRPELAERVSLALRQATGDSGAQRSINACANRAAELALSAYNGDSDETCLVNAARESGVPYYAVIQAAADGDLPAARKGKQVYVTGRDYALWFVAYRERLLAQEELLNTLDGIDLITKQEAMALTGLCETHMTRYLRTGVIDAWLLPGIRTGRPGEWLVSKASVETFIAARSEGRLKALLDQNSAYVTLRRRITGEIRGLRRTGRLNRPDPLDRPKSLYHPGCFTVKQVASHTGLSAQAVYEAIANGRLAAEVCRAGGRPRYAVSPKEAHRFAGEVGCRAAAVRRDTRHLRHIAAAGLLTVRDLAQRWGISERAVLLRTKRTGLPWRKWGRYCVFEPAIIEVLEAQERNDSMIAMATKTTRTGVAAKHPAPTESEAAYWSALNLVACIDRDLAQGVRHYRTKTGALLTTLDEVVRAILNDNLAQWCS